jgi:hypothetical protein
MIVARYGVPGNCVKRCARPGWDDRTSSSWSASRFASKSNHRSSLRDGRVFSTISRHFVPGYYQMILPPSPRRRFADISFAVIHDRAKRPALARRSEVVNNCAASHNSAGGRPALARSRSSLRGAAFVLRARRSSKSEGGLRASDFAQLSAKFHRRLRLRRTRRRTGPD